MNYQAISTAWQQLLRNYTSDTALVGSEWQRIHTAYTHPKRHYHNLQHIAQMLGLLLQYDALVTDRDALLFATFYHDIVYKPSRQDNEHQSALAAIAFLEKINYPQAAKVAAYIEATKTHETALQDADLDLFLDTDMQILAAAPDDYMRYAAQVRKEYSIYPDLLYKPGRRKVLQQFLDMPAIYRTPAFRAQYEAAARTNISAELQQL